jgi:hypothetical protein
MKVADRALLWRGDGDEPEWGVMGVATIERIEGSEKKRGIFLRLDRLFEPPITPYPSNSPRTTPESDFLWKVLGEAFRPLHKVFKRLEYPARESFKTSPITVWPMTGRQFEALSLRRPEGAVSETTAQRLAALPRDPAEVSAIEGEPRMFSHMLRERCPALVRAKREVARNSAGQLECEACGFVAETAYPGILSGELCDVHHRIPLGDLVAATTETRLEDLAVLCPNCHRAIHQTRPMWSVEDLRDWLRRRQV